MESLGAVSAVLKQKGGQIWSVSPDATVFEALRLMAEKQVGLLVVLEGGGLAGVFSERDYARKIALVGRSSRDTPVREIMTSPAITIPPSFSVNDAMHLMTEKHIRHLPVVGEMEALVGVVSIGDLVKWIITSQGEMIEHLQSYIAGQS
jgi:CBS domain-containing protein